MAEADTSTRYLGLPNLLGQKKSVLLGFLKTKLEQKIRVWERKPVSKAGQEILIKMVGQSLPTYAMSVFLLPVDLIKNIEGMLTKFWWNTTQSGKKKIHWASWENLCKHKSIGGLGFKDLHSFNLAMLGKQGWRFQSNPNGLASRVYKAKYFRHGNFLNSKLGANPSFTWRSVWEAKEVVSAGACWRIGSGNEVDISGQPWLADPENSYITTESESFQQNKVTGLMCLDSRAWDHEVVKDLFNSRDQKCILETPIYEGDDIIYWKHDFSGEYTVKSAYKLIQRLKGAFNSAQKSEVLLRLWKIKAPPKVINVAWRALCGFLPTLVQLQFKHVQVDTHCPVCLQEEETILHSLVLCPFAQSCWNIIFHGFQVNQNQNFGEWLSNIFDKEHQDMNALIITVCWSLWRARNDVVWNRKYTKANRVIASAKQ